MKASVIVCTYNRVELLTDTLRSLQQLSYPATDYEVIVVDNNSSDNTAELVAALASNSPVKIAYVHESRQGLSYARNTGITHAKGEIVVFTDDDIEADPLWLQDIVATFNSPEVYCVGGPIRPIWLSPRPEWLSDNLIGYLTIQEFEYAAQSRELTSASYPSGANIAFRRVLFEELGYFDTELGRKGKLLLSNEESRVCSMIEAAGKKIRLASNAIIYHKIPAERLTRKWFYNRLYWQGVSDAIMDISLSKESDVIANNIYGNIRRWTNIDFDAFTYKCISKYLRGYAIGAGEGSSRHDNLKIARIMNIIVKGISDNNKLFPLQLQLDDCHNINNELRTKIYKFETSISWKITQPVRAFGDLANKLMGFLRRR